MKHNSYTVANVPVMRHNRSRFDLSHRVLTSGSVGYLYPFELQEVLPGDTFKVSTTMVARLASTFVKPIMDNLFVDVYYFFVPNRLVYDKWEQVFGENRSSAWAQSEEVLVPTFQPASGSTIAFMSATQNGGNRQVAACFGFPLDKSFYLKGYDEDHPERGYDISVLPFRAFAMIYDEFFRDQNNVAPMHIQKGASTAATEKVSNAEWAPNSYCGRVPKVAKTHDYFTSCLPAPQKGSAVDIPLSLTGNIPVYAGNVHSIYGHNNPITFTQQADISVASGKAYPLFGLKPATTDSLLGTGVNTVESVAIDSDFDVIVPNNLWAEASANAFTSGISVNDLRFAFQYQKMLERLARGGTRYIEWLQSAFGVSAGDTRLQRPEFLGGKRIPINIQQVAQTTGSENNDLGEVGAYSLTAGGSKWTKSFVEHGYVIGVYCIRQFHSYQQGLARHWSRKSKVDFFDPAFATIGEQPVYKHQLFASSAATYVPESNIFGYQEAWAEYRANPNIITGQMNSYATDHMDYWHLGDKYASAPVLGQTFIEETSANLDRDISVAASSQDQFILDFWVNNIAVRPLPTYSVPGLIDHH